jgi:TonB-dependent starch-binding outer membrane protein SusC
MKKPLLLGCMLACTLIYPSFSQELVTNVSGSAYAMVNSGRQDNENSSLEEVLNTLQSRYKISILYKSDLVKDKIVKNPSYDGSIQEALINVLKPLGLKFKNPKSSLFIIVRENESKDLKISEIDSKTITTEEATAFATQTNDLQLLASLKMSLEKVADVPVKGKVTSETGDGLPGVSVVVKGTTLGTTTNAGGEYSLNIPDGNAVLVFSFIGYSTEEIAVGSRTIIDVKLTPDVESLQEVVVVGYGTQKKTSVTGAISTVSSKDIAVQPVINVSQALQGRVAGVSVINNGSPGTAPIVRVRGVGTINNQNPLYVIDGIPTSDLNSFDPKDIESLEVLKDASSAAIYGSRASNGVILITTKRGSNKKVSVNLESYYGAEKAWKQLDLLNTEQYIAFADDLLDGAVPARIKTGLDQPINSQSSQTFRQTNTDWQKEMFRAGAIQQHKIDISGGNEKSKIFTSASYFSQEGIMLGGGYERGNIRLNSDHNISKRITIGNSFYVSYDDQSQEPTPGGRTQIQSMVRSMPYLPVYNPDKFGGFQGAEGIDGSDPENPVRGAMMDKTKNRRFKFLGNIYGELKIFDFLSYRFTMGADYTTLVQRGHNAAYNAGTSSRNQAQINQRREQFNSIVLTNQLNFNKSFGDHTISAALVAEQQTFNFSQINGNGNNPNSNFIQEPSSLTNQVFGGSASESALISYIARLNYDFKNKYLIGASFRSDGTSKFEKNNRWGNFPAVSAGWRVSEEGFLRDNNFLTDLKIRGSYGVTGNNGTNDYPTQPVIGGNQYYEFDNTSSTLSQGLTVRGLVDRDLRWEKTEMADVGIDVGLLNNKVTFTADYFSNTTKDMILVVPIPSSLGYDNAPSTNIGSVRNKGLEFQLGYNKSEGDFKWSASGNISFIRNEVLALTSESSTIAAASEIGYGDNITMTKKGESIQYFNGYLTDGIFQTDDEAAAYVGVDGKTKLQPSAKAGDIRFKNLNNDNALDESDKTKIGSFLPDFSYGVNLSANWKGIDATMFLQGVQGNEIYSVIAYDLEGMSRLFNSSTKVLNRWTTPGQNTDVPRAVNSDPNKNVRASDRFISDGSYLRIKNFTVGYALPSNIISKFAGTSINKVRVYFTSQNLLTLTKYKDGYDPEIGNRTGGLAQGIDYGQYPQARSFIFGLQVGF